MRGEPEAEVTKTISWLQKAYGADKVRVFTELPRYLHRYDKIAAAILEQEEAGKQKDKKSFKRDKSENDEDNED